jgi:hypothetical protein
MDNYKYFIEHKDLHTWITIDGTLTNDPNHKSLVTFNDSFTAEDCLKPKTPDMTSDFSGNHVSYDWSGVHLWEMMRERIMEKSQSDLYKDFIVTEHLFL